MTTTNPDDHDQRQQPARPGGYASVDQPDGCIAVEAMQRVLAEANPQDPVVAIVNIATGEEERITDTVISAAPDEPLVALCIRTRNNIALSVGSLSARLSTLGAETPVRLRPAADLELAVAITAVMADSESDRPTVYVYVGPIA